jgi:two-component system, OmpR family, sensor kinase
MTSRMFRHASLRSQIVLSTAALMAALVLVVGVGLQILLEVTAHRDVDRVLAERADTVVASVLAASDETLTVPADALDPGAVLYDGRGAAIAGSVEQQARAAADRLGRSHTPATVEVADRLRLHAVPFTSGSGDRGVVVVSLDTMPYERSERYALLATVLLALVVVATAAAMAGRATDRALAPVSRMAERATEWSEHDLGRRFALGPPTNELAALGETLDHLLDRVARAIRSEQRLTSELAHELRTPLTAIQGSADLALLRGVDDEETRHELEQISASAHTMAATITTLLELARDESSARDRDTCAVGDLVAPVRSLVPEGLRFVDLVGASSARVAAPSGLVLRALGPLVDNAARHARSEVTLATSTEDGLVALTVGDDGAGIDADVRGALFRPGTSGADSTGLGLGIARRVARSLGGDVLVADDAGHTTFTVRLPRA